MSAAVKLSILMPVYNEAKTVQTVIKRVLDVSFPCQVEVVIVDYASTDGTAEIIEQVHDEEADETPPPGEPRQGSRDPHRDRGRPPVISWCRWTRTWSTSRKRSSNCSNRS